MEDQEIAAKMITIRAQTLAIRDVVARLLTYEALRWGDPADALRDISETTDIHIATMSRTDVEFEEVIRKEVDWIVSAARMMVTRRKNP